MVDIFKLLKEIFVQPKADDKADDKADEEQPDTTDMPDLESQKSAEQRKKKKGQVLKNLTPN